MIGQLKDNFTGEFDDSFIVLGQLDEHQRTIRGQEQVIMMIMRKKEYCRKQMVWYKNMGVNDMRHGYVYTTIAKRQRVIMQMIGDNEFQQIILACHEKVSALQCILLTSQMSLTNKS